MQGQLDIWIVDPLLDLNVHTENKLHSHTYLNTRIFLSRKYGTFSDAGLDRVWRAGRYATVSGIVQMGETNETAS